MRHLIEEAQYDRKFKKISKEVNKYLKKGVPARDKLNSEQPEAEDMRIDELSETPSSLHESELSDLIYYLHRDPKDPE